MKIRVVKNPQEGIDCLKELLYQNVNNGTVLFLSGGKTPKEAYSQLAQEGEVKPGAAVMVDERFGKKMHENSNEKMFLDSGLLNYFKDQKVPFYPILKGRKGLLELTKKYDVKVKSLLEKFPKSVVILGIGEDGHIASLPADRVPAFAEASTFANASADRTAGKQNYVESVDNFPGEFRERITLTFKALEQMGLLIVLVLGSAKQKALNLMFEEGSLGEIPARFFTKPDISIKVILITDQNIADGV